MKNKKICSVFVLLIYAMSILAYVIVALHPIFVDAYSDDISEQPTIIAEEVEVNTECNTQVVMEPEQTVDISNESASDSDIELLALVTLAEAEGESETGKRLVIDTVLNRVDNKQFPNTISEVIYQKNQFTSMYNGRCDRVTVNDETRRLVREEMRSRVNAEVLYFTAGGYGKYGTHLFKEGNHYFCGE